MIHHRVICVNHAEISGQGHHHQHTHIVNIGTSSGTPQIERRWSLSEVLEAMDRGDRFYTEGEESYKVAEVEKYHCSRCGGTHIRTKPDHTTDNNLDKLKQCPAVPSHHPTRDKHDRPPQPDRRHA